MRRRLHRRAQGELPHQGLLAYWPPSPGRDALHPLQAPPPKRAQPRCHTRCHPRPTPQVQAREGSGEEIARRILTSDVGPAARGTSRPPGEIQDSKSIPGYVSSAQHPSRRSSRRLRVCSLRSWLNISKPLCCQEVLSVFVVARDLVFPVWAAGL